MEWRTSVMFFSEAVALRPLVVSQNETALPLRHRADCICIAVSVKPILRFKLRLCSRAAVPRWWYALRRLFHASEKSYGAPLLPTVLVGSYPQPDWLIDRQKLAGRFPPRVRARELWRVAPEWLEQAQDDATLIAIRDQERAGLDIITDGEMRRESYSNRFATALEGVDIDNPGTGVDRSGHPNPVPRVVGKIRRKHPVEVRDLQFLRANTDRKIKITVPGPFTMTQQAQNDYYPREEDLALDYAAAVNEEIKDLFAAGADIVQLDEPYMQARAEKARQYGLATLKRALDGVTGTTALHICFGYAAIIHERPSGYSFLPELAESPVQQISIETAQSSLDCSVLQKLPGKTIVLGVLDLSTHEIETPEAVAARIRRALPFLSPDRVIVAPDCGLKYLPRNVAFGKMKAMVDGAKLVRSELTARAAGS
jgi:5-methyltetrahydropteroyltriglutamate--homocysteine methyltransferase